MKLEDTVKIDEFNQLKNRFDTDVVKMDQLIEIKREVENCVKQSEINNFQQEVIGFRKVIGSFVSREELENRINTNQSFTNAKLDEKIGQGKFDKEYKKQ